MRKKKSISVLKTFYQHFIEKFISIFKGYNKKWSDLNFEELLRVLYRKTTYIGPPIVLYKSRVPTQKIKESLGKSYVETMTIRGLHFQFISLWRNSIKKRKVVYTTYLLPLIHVHFLIIIS